MDLTYGEAGTKSSSYVEYRRVGYISGSIAAMKVRPRVQLQAGVFVTFCVLVYDYIFA